MGSMSSKRVYMEEMVSQESALLKDVYLYHLKILVNPDGIGNISFCWTAFSPFFEEKSVKIRSTLYLEKKLCDGNGISNKEHKVFDDSLVCNVELMLTSDGAECFSGLNVFIKLSQSLQALIRRLVSRGLVLSTQRVNSPYVGLSTKWKGSLAVTSMMEGPLEVSSEPVQRLNDFSNRDIYGATFAGFVKEEVEAVQGDLGTECIMILARKACQVLEVSTSKHLLMDALRNFLDINSGVFDGGDVSDVQKVVDNLFFRHMFAKILGDKIVMIIESNWPRGVNNMRLSIGITNSFEFCIRADAVAMISDSSGRVLLNADLIMGMRPNTGCNVNMLTLCVGRIDAENEFCCCYYLALNFDEVEFRTKVGHVLCPQSGNHCDDILIGISIASNSANAGQPREWMFACHDGCQDANAFASFRLSEAGDDLTFVGFIWAPAVYVPEGTARMMKCMLRILGCELGGYTYFTMS